MRSTSGEWRIASSGSSPTRRPDFERYDVRAKIAEAVPSIPGESSAGRAHHVDESREIRFRRGVVQDARAQHETTVERGLSQERGSGGLHLLHDALVERIEGGTVSSLQGRRHVAEADDGELDVTQSFEIRRRIDELG